MNGQKTEYIFGYANDQFLSRNIYATSIEDAIFQFKALEMYPEHMTLKNGRKDGTILISISKNDTTEIIDSLKLSECLDFTYGDVIPNFSEFLTKSSFRIAIEKNQEKINELQHAIDNLKQKNDEWMSALYEAIKNVSFDNSIVDEFVIKMLGSFDCINNNIIEVYDFTKNDVLNISTIIGDNITEEDSDTSILMAIHKFLNINNQSVVVFNRNDRKLVLIYSGIGIITACSKSPVILGDETTAKLSKIAFKNIDSYVFRRHQFHQNDYSKLNIINGFFGKFIDDNSCVELLKKREINIELFEKFLSENAKKLKFDVDDIAMISALKSIFEYRFKCDIDKIALKTLKMMIDNNKVKRYNMT